MQISYIRSYYSYVRSNCITCYMCVYVLSYVLVIVSYGRVLKLISASKASIPQAVIREFVRLLANNPVPKLN